MRMTAHLQTAKIDIARYKQALATYLTGKLKDAIRVWLNSTVRAVVPTWSGASRATFEKIASLADTSISYGPQKSRKDRKPLGRQESEGYVKLERNSGFFSFTWSTSLRYFILNNYTYQTYDPTAKDTGSGKIYSPSGLRHPGPYNLEERGKTALEGFSKNLALPNPYAFLVVKNIKV